MTSSSMTSFSYLAKDEGDTSRLASALARALPTTMVIALDGPLGAGKTTFVRALATALGADEHSVASPTFVLVHHYSGQRPIYHFDAYRIHSIDEFLELGCEEYFEGPGISLIEWAHKVSGCLPADRIEIRIEVVSLRSRRFAILGRGPDAETVVRELARALDLATN